MATAKNITYNIVAKDKFTGVADAVSRKVESLRQKFRKFSADLEAQGVTFKSVGDKLGSWASKMKWVSGGVIAAGTAALYAASNYEKLGIQFEILTGSAAKGQALLKELRDLTLTAGPFESEEIMTAAKALLNYKVGVKDITSNMKTLMTLAAGAELPLQTVSDAFGYSNKTGFVSTRALRPLKKLGLRELMMARLNMVGKNKEFDQLIAQKKVPATLLFEVMNDKAKTYGNLLERIDGTIGEIVGDIKELSIQNSAVAGGILDENTGIREVLIAIATNMKSVRDEMVNFTNAHPGVVKIVLAIGAFLIVLTPLLAALSMVALVLGGLASIAAATGIAFGAIVLIAGGVVAAFVAIGAAIYGAYKYWDQLQDIWSRSNTRKILEWVGLVDATQHNAATVDLTIHNPNQMKIGATGRATPGLNLGINMPFAGKPK